MTKIVSHTTRNPAKRSYLLSEVKRIAETLELHFVEPDDNPAVILEGAEIFLTYSFQRSWWKGCIDLKWIHVGGAGVNHILFPELLESEVIITNCREMSAGTMAEYTLGVMFYFAQRLNLAEEWKHKRKWHDAKIPMTQGSFKLLGKRVLILGAGNVGKAVMELCLTIGMTVDMVNRSGAGDFPAGVGIGDIANLDYFLSKADFIVIALPLTNKTYNFVDWHRISRMKSSAVIINISRGRILDEEALVEALNSNIISGACLDVFAEEPLPEDSPLFEVKNLLITPHIAGNYPEYTLDMIDMFLENLARYLQGEELINVVDLQRGY